MASLAGWLQQRWRALLAEFLGTALLVLLGCATVRSNAALSEPALGWGCVVAALATALGPVSGAHMNPSVTLGAAITRHLPPATAAAYVAAQCIGGTVGYGLLWLMVPGAYAVTAPAAGVHALQAAGVEAVMTGTLVLVVCAVCAGPHDASAPIKVGLTIAGLVYVGGPLSGASLNPARSLAPALVHRQWSSHWVYWLGPLGGAALAASAHRWLLTAPPSRDRDLTAPASRDLTDPGPALPLLDKQPAAVA